MSYTVLARRYRSTTFDEVIGQEHVAQTLKRAIESGRIAHAYLFCGTRGTGKTSMARILAKALNCEKHDAPTTTPCNKCESCLAIARGDDIDVIEIDAASNTGVDNVREIIENAQYRPARSRFKVYIIDEAHMLSKQAFNALLKTLEEPPGHVKFILATTEPEKLLPTILSRVQRYDFRNIPTREIAAHLKDICKREKIKADDDALLLVAKAGAGSMRDSLSLLDRLLSVGEKELTPEMIEQLLGMPKAQVIFDLVQSMGEGDTKGVLERSAKLVTQGLSPDTLVASLTDHLRNLLVIRACGPDSELVEVPGVGMEELQQQAERFDAVTLSQDIAILEELRRNLRNSTAGRALLDATLVRLALAEQFASVEELLLTGGDGAAATTARASASARRPAAPAPALTPAPALKKSAEAQLTAPPSPCTQGEGRGEGQAVGPDAAPGSTVVARDDDDGEEADDDDDGLPRPGKVWDNSGPSLSELLKSSPYGSSSTTAVAEAPRGTTSTPSNVEPVTPSDLSDVFTKLREAVARHGPGIDGFLHGGRLLAVDQGRAVISYPHDFEASARMLDRNGKKEIIQRELSSLLGESVGVRFEVEPAPPPALATPQQDDATKLDAASQRLTASRAPVRSSASSRPGAAEAAPPVNAAPVAPQIRVTPELREQLRADPLINAVMTELGGDIVKVE